VKFEDKFEHGQALDVAEKFWYAQVRRAETEATITSGFDRDVLRLTKEDVKFLQDCGIEAS